MTDSNIDHLESGFVPSGLDVESLKITKNTKGYNWEYRLVGKPEDQLDRIDTLEKELKTKFKQEEEDDKQEV